MGKIVVGMDTSSGAAEALRWALSHREQRGGEVLAVMVWSYLDQAHAGPGGQFDPAYSDANARAALDRAVVQAVGEEAAPAIGREVVCDLPAAGLLAAAADADADADLLVVGARGLGGFRSLLLGSVSEQCLHHATCPVAVIRSPEAPTPGQPRGERGRIVVGVDGSSHAQHALGWAIHEALARQAILEVVYAWRSQALDFGPGVYTPDAANLEADAHHILQEAVAAEGPLESNLQVQHTVARGLPAQVILETAKDADLVVTGTRGRGGFKELLLGSTSHQVAHHATCPVVVVPSPGRA